MDKLNQLIKQLLNLRGIVTEDEINEFFSDSPTFNLNPFLMHHMSEGVDLLYDTIKNGKKICIYGDYDVDGITAVALLYQFFSDCIGYDEIGYYIPHRMEEGYGLNEEAIKSISQSYDMIITVDCGTISVKEVELAHALGMEIIITDHHDSLDIIPDTVVINPKLGNYENPYLSGCGVAYKFTQAYRQKYLHAGMSYDDSIITIKQEKFYKQAVNKGLDLVGISIVCDVCPVISENRSYLKYAIKMLRSDSRPQVSELLKRVKKDVKNLTARDIGFILGPHINAVGRLGDASRVETFFISKDSEELSKTIDFMISKNIERKDFQADCFLECDDLVRSEFSNDKFLLLNPKKGHEGVSGIVAGKIREKYALPCAVLSKSEDMRGDINIFKGSARSLKNLDMIALLRKFDGRFLKLGGHGMAAGFSILENEIPLLKLDLEEEIRKLLSENRNLLDNKIAFDKELNFDDMSEIDIKTIEILERFAPYGPKNEKPLFLVKNVLPKSDIINIKTMGSDNNHLSFIMRDMKCIFFYVEDEKKNFLFGKEPVDMYFEADINEWKNNIEKQFIIRDVHRSCEVR